MKNPLFLFLLCGLISQCACKKSLLNTDDDDNMPPMTELEKLPPITSEGANTFGCLVNGEAWTPKGYIFPESNFDVYYDEVYYNRLSIKMYKKENNQSSTEYITIGVRMVDNTNTIDTSENKRISLTNFFECIEYDKILIEDFHIANLDTINKVVSGTFNFIVTVDDNNPCKDTIYVTDGRFDAEYRF